MDFDKALSRASPLIEVIRSMQVDFLVILDTSDLRHCEASVSQCSCYVFSRLRAMNINFRNRALPQQIIGVVVELESLFSSRLPVLLDLIDPLETLLLLVAWLDSKVSKWAHLRVDERVS